MSISHAILKQAPITAASKIILIYFMFDRKLLTKLSRCAWPPARRPTARREELFRHEVFKMLKAEGKINDVVIGNMMNWPPARRALSLRLGEHHSGFNVYCGNAIWPHNEDGLENLARGTCPPQEDHPSVFFSRAHDLYCGQ